MSSSISEQTPILGTGSSGTGRRERSSGGVLGSMLYYVDSEEYCCFIPADMIFLPPDRHHVKMHNNRFFSLVLLFLVMVGSGSLTQPYAVAQMGVILSGFVYLFVGTFVFFGIYILIKSAEITGVYHYGNLAGAVLGETGKQVTEWSIIISLLFDGVSILLVLTSLLRGIVTYFQPNVPWYLNDNFLMVLMSTAIILPICLIRRLGHLTYAAMVSQFGMLAVVIGMLADGISGDSIYEDEDIPYASLMGFLNSSGIVVWGVTFAVGVFHVHRAMEKPSAHELVVDCAITAIAGTLFLAAVGFIGFFSFRESTRPIILDNFSSLLGVVFRVFALIYYIFYAPSDFVMGRASFANSFGVEVEDMQNDSYLSFTICAVLMVEVVTVLLNIFAPDNAVSYVQNLAGGLAGGIWTFIIPGMIGRYLFSNSIHSSSKRGSGSGSDDDTGDDHIAAIDSGDSNIGSSVSSIVQKKASDPSNSMLYIGSIVIEVVGYLMIAVVLVGVALY